MKAIVMSNSNVPIFVHVKSEVEIIIEELRVNLFKQLHDPLKPMQEQTKTIT